MSLTIDQLVERLHVFSQKTLEWCSQESEVSTARVTVAIDLLLQNTARVSQISAESVAAIQGLQKAISIRFAERNKENFAKLIQNLEVLAGEHAEVQNVIQPIIQALQFQDKLRQNLENAVRMLPVWIEFRKDLPMQITPEKLQEFGKALMTKTTMISERDVVRAHIDGLASEPDIAPVVLF
jgi:crotonobetainyl-CoA:carnitine CoA-transferase CaiB-like acyl-CoA transferase